MPNDKTNILYASSMQAIILIRLTIEYMPNQFCGDERESIFCNKHNQLSDFVIGFHYHYPIETSFAINVSKHKSIHFELSLSACLDHRCQN